MPRVAGTVVSGLRTPWDIAFLPDGSALVTERDSGRVVRVTAAGAVRTVGVVPGVVHAGEGGLLGLTLSPRFGVDRLLYAYHTTAGDNRVVRMRYAGGALGPPRAILTGIPRGVAHHNGGRLRFGPDGMLYVPTGDAYDRANAQDRGSLGGKILRVRPDGSPAPGNPDPRSPIWTLGHRNVEGLAFDGAGRAWASEFGSNVADELNLIRRGGNYGWPAVEGTGGRARGYVDPLATWPVAEASPSGIAYTPGTIWLAALRGERLWRVRVRGRSVVGRPVGFFEGRYGRLRAVQPAPDGSLWLATSNTDGRAVPRRGDDRILRVVLAPAS